MASHGLKWGCCCLDDDDASEVPGSSPDEDAAPPSAVPSRLPGRLRRPCGLPGAWPSGGACLDLSGDRMLQGLDSGHWPLRSPWRPMPVEAESLKRPPKLLLLCSSSARKVGKGSCGGDVATWLACLRTKPEVINVRYFWNPLSKNRG